METVKIHICIDINQEDDADTGVSVIAFHAMTQSQRSKIAQDIWMDMAGADNGGLHVITEGAVEV